MTHVLLKKVALDVEEAIKQWKWLCKQADELMGPGLEHPDELEGLLSMFDEFWVDIFKDTAIYTNGGKTLDRYTVVFSDGLVYAMSWDADAPTGVSRRILEGAVLSPRRSSGQPTATAIWLVSVLDVEPGVRAKIREILADSGMDED